MTRTQYVMGATIWADERGVRVVPWTDRFGNIEAGMFGCVPVPGDKWTGYGDPEADQ